ncbi:MULTISPECIES: hypothetical protein [unclassified Coleofasciculus]|uniref:hypothetical protein n=1 Tax=unclassified Coleofasciculus TaxID=2692782 RepID=UPI00187F8138|nr:MULTISPECIES: hypothetical protein [unclassified Coleofasciculus]MBE9126387.1 hypothetical protein [Coleofasciculus sp. LEGE 07081]MBE9149834.1 hypothetical protein [Coleofasciculus sp. LEGE 07092]
MKGIKLGSVLSLGILLALVGNRVNALPGQTVETVAAWISAHPTLQPGIGDGLVVTKSNSAAQRFTFKASVLPPGQIAFPTSRNIIRNEEISFYDKINGVTPERLTESLRIIYGPAVYQDYQRARLVYAYPTPETIDLARRQNLPLLAAQKGQLLLGDRFAYWWEVTQSEDGKALNGLLTIFLPEDLDKLESELRDRS